MSMALQVLGLFVGSLFFLVPAYLIWLFVLVKRVWRGPVTSRIISVVAAYASLVAVSITGAASNEGWGPLNVVGPLPGALALGAFVVWRIKKMHAQANESEIFR